VGLFQMDNAPPPTRGKQPPAKWGCFNPLFEAGAYYLPLLQLSTDATSGIAIRLIANIVREQPSYREDVVALLDSPNWRTHLIASIAILLSGDSGHFVPSLWATFDRGSWVAPQLAVVISICDLQFASHARQRLAGARSLAPQLSAKSVASLLQVLSTISSECQWAEQTKRASDVQTVLQADVDMSGKIAAYWAENLRQRFAELDIALPVVAGS
jgi:hypothetical protein